MAAALCAAALCVGPALGQQAVITGEIRTASSLNAAQRQVIQDFANQRFDLLANGGPDERPRARTALVRELDSPSASDAFERELAQAVLPKARDLLAPANDDSTRLNAMIVVAAMANDDALGLMAERLSDANVAVRYWAAQGLAEAVAARQGELGGQRTPVQQAILARMAEEPSAEAASHLFQVLSLLQQPPGIQEMGEGLVARVPLHRDNPAMSHLDTRVALRQAKVRLTVLQEINPGAVAPARRVLAAAACRHALVIADQLANGLVEDEPTRVAHAATLQAIHESLSGWWRDAGGSPGARPNNDVVLNPLRFGNWGAMPRAFDQWRQALTAPNNPMGLTAADLEDAPAE
ncbi:MAG: hypothetical protein AAF612_00950 [Planctomycetota bacterium]